MHWNMVFCITQVFSCLIVIFHDLSAHKNPTHVSHIKHLKLVEIIIDIDIGNNEATNNTDDQEYEDDEGFLLSHKFKVIIALDSQCVV